MTEPYAGEIVGREHQLPVRIYYEDTDFTGVVHPAIPKHWRRCTSPAWAFNAWGGTDHAGFDG